MSRKITIKLLTIFSLFIFCQEVFSSRAVEQEVAKSHLRWNIFTEKDSIVIDRDKKQVLIRTLNSALYDQVKKDLEAIKPNKRYIEKIVYRPPNTRNNVSEIVVTLKESDVEMFSFYKSREKKYILDFWKDTESTDKISDIDKNSKKRAGLKKRPRRSISSKTIPKIDSSISASTIPKFLAPKKNISSKIKEKLKLKRHKKPVMDIDPDGYRDFRYGAAFIWNYEGFGPKLSDRINTNSKTPEFFFPIKNRDISKGDEESHLQLSINLFRKKKYGLMYKSIELFGQKYPNSKLAHMNEYLKVNAILRDHINKGNRAPLKMVINMLRSISESSSDYDMTKAIVKYLMSYYVKNKEYVEVLKQAKRFYVLSKENYDYEESAYAAEAIFYSLSMMNQVQRVEEVLQEKTIAKLLSRQLQLAYRIFVAHRFGDMTKVIRVYEDNKKNLVGKVFPSILFNVGEAYFRLGKFDKSVKMFDSFLSNYSYLDKSDEARLRLALAFEIMDKDKKQTLLLYKNAINRSNNAEVSREAKFRYTAMRSVRKFKPTAEDLETRVFLDFAPNISLNGNLKKLLWIIRLRTFINDKKYRDAMKYLQAVPLTSLRPSERRSFEADGSEIVYGIIHDYYEKGDYSNIVKTWNLYKKRYITKVANDPYMNFVVGQSYLRLGLYKGFEKLYVRFKKLNNQPIKTFPYWGERVELGDKIAILKELSIIKNIKLSNWDLARDDILELRSIKGASERYYYYLGIIEFKKENYKAATKNFENFLSSQKSDIELDPQDLANLIRYYTDSIYEQGLIDKYQEVSQAVLKDTEKLTNANPFLNEVIQRLEYMNIEVLAGKDDKESYLLMEKKINDFFKKYEKPENAGRIKYLLGRAYVKNMNYEKGKKVLEKVLEDEKISEYIKELVKSELSLINIKKRIL